MTNKLQPEIPQALFLFSDTGGGHRSAAEAIIEAIDLEFGGLFITRMVDIFMECAPVPLNHLPAIYPKIARYQTAWNLGYRWSNHDLGVRWINMGAWPYVQRSIKRLISQHYSDLIVSLYPLAIGPMLRALGDITFEIASTCSFACLIVVCGRNQALKRNLQSQEWPIPVHVYGFVNEMSDYMHAADMLVTKAGPGTISKALNAKVPMILYIRLPGQEDWNVPYLVSEGASVWVPTPEMVSAAVNYWINHPVKYHEAVSACQ